MSANNLASKVAHSMLAKEGTGPAWGVVIEEAREGYARLSMEVRADMLIPLRHGEPIRFGTDGEKGVVADADGRVRVVDVGEVGEDRLLVHDETRDDPGLAFALSRLSRGPFEPTPIGVFRAVERPEYVAETNRQLAMAAAQDSAPDLAALLRSGATWEVAAS